MCYIFLHHSVACGVCMIWDSGYHGDYNAKLNSDLSLLHISSHLNFPSSRTGFSVFSVRILVMGCVSYTAMIMFSSPQHGRSSLMFASQNGHNEVVRMLLSASAKVDLQNKVSTTSLFHSDFCPDVMWQSM